MKRVLPLIFCLWPLLGSAQTEPRISQVLPAPTMSVESRAVDADGDGDLDLLFAADYENFPTWIENLGAREFADPKIIHFPKLFGRQNPADLNGDGTLDFLSSTRSDEVIDGVSADRFSAVIANEKLRGVRVIDLGVSPGTMKAVDIDVDGKAEILVLEPSGDSISQRVLRLLNLEESGDLVERADPVPLDENLNGEATAIDVDGDGDLDLRSGDYLLERTGDRTFSDVVRPLPLFLFDPVVDAVGIPEPADFADLDGDGLRDYFLKGEDVVGWCKKDPLGFSFAEPQLFDVPGKILRIDSREGLPALLTVFVDIETENDYELRLRQIEFGTGVVISDFLWQMDSPGLELNDDTPELVADFDGDGILDVFARPQVYRPSGNMGAAHRPAVMWGMPEGYSSVEFISSVPFNHQAGIETGDLEGDGDIDVLIGPDIFGSYRVLVNDGEENFAESGTLDGMVPTELAETGVRIGSIKGVDLNGDGKLDLMVNFIKRELFIYEEHVAVFVEGNGDGTFGPPVFPPGAFDFSFNDSPCDDLVDWDGDGDVDAMRFGSWHENEDGVLSESATPLLSAAFVPDALGNVIQLGGFSYGDLDGDGRSDIVSHVFEIETGETGFRSTAMGIGYSDAFGGIEEVAVVPAILAGGDAFGSPTVFGTCQILDLNKDGNNDLVYDELAGTDALGNPISVKRWKRNPGNGSRNPATWLTNILRADPIFPGDFDGDGQMDWTDGYRVITPTLAGPKISPSYDFATETIDDYHDLKVVADFDGDGDGDLMMGRSNQLNLVRNLIIDERSGVAARMRTLGVLGKRANPDDDADGDGRCNAAEFLDGTDPEVVDEACPDRSRPELSFADGAVSVSFENRDDAGELDLSYILESSPDLVTWTPVEDEGATTQDLPDPWRVSEIPLGETEERAFFRVRKTHVVPVE